MKDQVDDRSLRVRGRTPSEIDEFKSASRSTSRTDLPESASTVATFTAVVVLPTPPLGLNAAMIMGLHGPQPRTCFGIIAGALCVLALAMLA